MKCPSVWTATLTGSLTMPSKGTPPRTIRVEDALWDAAKETARTRGDNLSEIIRQALNTYVKQHKGEE